MQKDSKRCRAPELRDAQRKTMRGKEVERQKGTSRGREIEG